MSAKRERVCAPDLDGSRMKPSVQNQNRKWEGLVFKGIPVMTYLDGTGRSPQIQNMVTMARGPQRHLGKTLSMIISDVKKLKETSRFLRFLRFSRFHDGFQDFKERILRRFSCRISGLTRSFSRFLIGMHNMFYQANTNDHLLFKTDADTANIFIFICF